MELIEQLVIKLMNKKITISAMESCTGGAFSNAITNIPGSSEILKYGAVTYSNEFKIKMGVDANIIKKYSVYSMETAKEMSKNIKIFSDSDIGIGITGKLYCDDTSNPYGNNDKVYISILFDKYYCFEFKSKNVTRKENKDAIIEKISKELIKLID